MSSVEEIPTRQTLDLSNCDREQIQYAGAILPHGVLLTVREPDLTVLQAGMNSEAMLGIPLNQLLGASLEDLFSEWQLVTIRNHLKLTPLNDGPCYLLRASFCDAEFDVFAHRNDGVLIVELERYPGEPNSENSVYAELRSSMAKLDAATSLQTFIDLAVAQVRAFTGFDRVMAYKFKEDGSGCVFSESLAEGEGFTPYLGLHYPASDVPEPARRLFSLTWLRHQPDIEYTPVPIMPEMNPITGRPLDMTYALLRSVSVMYTEYLKNMGTKSSMVLTLMKEGKLWGLIACHHHRAPKHVPASARTLCEITAHMVSILMSAKEDLENLEYKIQLKSRKDLLVQGLSNEDDFAESLVTKLPVLLDCVRAAGTALLVDGRLETLGQVPEAAHIISLVRWLSVYREEDVFATDSLASLFPEAEIYQKTGSGLLAIRSSKDTNDYVLWFRPELIQTVHWAGDPGKPVNISEDGRRLTPRTSFALWAEHVRRKSAPWLEIEIESAAQLRLAILQARRRRAKDPGEAGDNTGTTLGEDYSEKLAEEAQTKLATLNRLSRRMDDQLDSLLEYGRGGRPRFADAQVDLNEVVAGSLEALRSRIKGARVEIRIPAELPPVVGHRADLGQLFTNLISNAIKYNNRASKWVEIGAQGNTFYVRDNGIGIPPEQKEQVFEIFRRLHGRDEFGGGAEAGLTIAKKIVEKHGGKIWVESEPGTGTVLRFTVAGVKD